MEVERLGDPIEVKTCFHQVLGRVGWAKIAPTHETVVTEALRAANADVLLDATIETRVSNFLVYTRSCTVVQGVPAKLKVAP
jgi:hypothetical protein